METFLQQLINGLTVGAIYALIALGYTMVYGILKLINFAHGDIYMAGAYIGYFTARGFGWRGQPTVTGLLVVLLLSMIGAAVLGMAIDRFAYRPVRRHSRMTTLITAIGMSLLLENLAVVFFGGAPRSFPQLLRFANYRLPGGATVSSSQLLIFGVSLVLTLLLQWLVFRTRVGTAMRAVSWSLDTSKLMGIDTDRIIAFTFAVGSALAAAGGVLTAQYNPQIDPLMGIMTGLKAFVAAVLGGIGNIPGAVLGGLVIGLAETFVVGYGQRVGIPSSYRDAVAFAILILVLLFRPTGLLGSTVREKV
jgi:branched-chain amino acid transport system permease protein